MPRLTTHLYDLIDSSSLTAKQKQAFYDIHAKASHNRSERQQEYYNFLLEIAKQDQDKTEIVL